MLLDLEKLKRLGWRQSWQSMVEATLLNKQSLYQTAPLADQDVVNAVLASRPE
jgi:hypothetical protein